MFGSSTFVYIIGFTAQLLFSARMIIQLFLSEKAGKSLSPTVYWQLSLLASLLLLSYGVMRGDLAIIFGQFLLYYIYIRNLQLKDNWKLFPGFMRMLIPFLPLVGLVYVFYFGEGSISEMWSNEDIGTKLVLFGVFAQMVFILRFIYQWFESEKKNESVLSRTFWIISLCGSLLILTYAILRMDPVLFLGHIVGATVYSRNIYLAGKGKNKTAN